MVTRGKITLGTAYKTLVLKELILGENEHKNQATEKKYSKEKPARTSKSSNRKNTQEKKSQPEHKNQATEKKFSREKPARTQKSSNRKSTQAKSQPVTIIKPK